MTSLSGRDPVTIGCSRFGKFAFAERRAPRANLRPSAATILSPMWRSPTRPGVGRDVEKEQHERDISRRSSSRAHFFLNPLKTADFVIRKSGLRIEDAGKYSSPRLSSLSPRSLS